VLRALEWHVDYGGKGFNVSRMLISLGGVSTALGFAGGDSGKLLHNGLVSSGIETDFIWIDGETRTNVSIVTADHDRYVKVNEPGPTILEEEQLALLAQVRRLAKANDWWVLCGSLPPGVPDDFYAQIISLVQRAEGYAILDASGAALRQGCKAGPLLAKPNEVEAHNLTGLPVYTATEIAAAAVKIQGLGVANVVISLGKKGAVLVEDKQAWLLASPAIMERNPIGAGDSLVGGLVWGLEQRLTLPEALRWGIACGAATASCNGTTVARRDEVEELVKLVTVSALD
jgi:1-phosphofructokinase family hexose kinase